jgi:hypothetical protein
MAATVRDRVERDDERLQVGREPGYGSVATSIAFGRSGATTRKPSPSVVDVAPASVSLSMTSSRWPGSPLWTTTSPRVSIAPKAQVPATMRSGTTRARPATALDPLDLEGRVPMPSMWAPIRRSMRHRSTTSGSRATLSMTCARARTAP